MRQTGPASPAPVSQALTADLAAIVAAWLAALTAERRASAHTVESYARDHDGLALSSRNVERNQR